MITLNYGLPGMGKTLLMHDFIRAHPNHRFFVVDHAAEWGPDALHWRGKAPKITIIEDKAPDEVEETGVFVFRGLEPLTVASLVQRIGNAVYVDDELDLTARKKGWDTSPLRAIVHQGRHIVNSQGEICEAHILGACRRPQNLHTDITDIADQVFIFKVQGSRTLQRLKDDSMIEDDEWNIIREMPKFQTRHWPSGKYMKIPPIGDANSNVNTDEPQLPEQRGTSSKFTFEVP